MNLRTTALALTLALAACNDSNSNEAGPDIGDAVADATHDAAQDIASDAPSDAAPDLPLDVVSDASVDAARDQGSDAEPSCDIPATYTYGPDGGLSPVHDVYRIEPGRRFTATRTAAPGFDAGAGTCTTMLDYCGTSDGGTVDTLAVIVALNDADVIAAFANQTSTVYGIDTRPVDGQVFAITRSDGHHFEIGNDCGGSASCRAIPAGLTRLRSVLERLTAQELARSTCPAR